MRHRYVWNDPVYCTNVCPGHHCYLRAYKYPIIKTIMVHLAAHWVSEIYIQYQMQESTLSRVHNLLNPPISEPRIAIN